MKRRRLKISRRLLLYYKPGSDIVPRGVDDLLVSGGAEHLGDADDGVDTLNARHKQRNAGEDHQRLCALKGIKDHQHAEHRARNAEQQRAPPA